MADWNPEENGVYFLYGVTHSKFIYSVGIGDSWEIKEILNEFDLTETEKLISALKEKRFEIDSIALDRKYGETWLDYSFEEPAPIQPTAQIEPTELPKFAKAKKPWWQFW